MLFCQGNWKLKYVTGQGCQPLPTAAQHRDLLFPGVSFSEMAAAAQNQKSYQSSSEL